MRAVRPTTTPNAKTKNKQQQQACDADTNASHNANKERKQKRKINPLSPPTTVTLNGGIQVHYPFRPYDVQITYMNTVIDALVKSENALLESPTGTGKTLCLLCASLAWQRHVQQMNALSSTNDDAIVSNSSINNNTNASAASSTINTRKRRVPTIIYASRTHSQLSQVVRELRSTRYRPRHAVLGSRDQMCIHPKISNTNNNNVDINYECNKLNKERKCSYRNNLENFTAPQSCTDTFSTVDGTHQPVMDLEDLIVMGKTSKVCPFYYTRNLLDHNTELILMPYNYLFDKETRENTLSDIQWDNSIIIFDEAHNLESFASDSASFDISNNDIAGCINEVTKCINFISTIGLGDDGGSNVKVDNVIKIKALLLQFENFLLNTIPSNQTAFCGEYIIEIFKQGCGITHANYEMFIDEVRKIHDLTMDLRGSGGSSSNNNGNNSRVSTKLEHFVQCLKRVYGDPYEARCYAKAAFYRVYVSPKQPQQPQSSSNNNNKFKNNNNNGRTISYWCFAPSIAMEELSNLNVRSIFVTSGTLAPLPSYGMELGLKFPHTLENPHIIKDDQIYVRVIGKGPNNKLLTSSYERRSDGDYYSELGKTIISLAKVIPAGMLIFFPSYSVMDTCIERWGGPSNNNYYSNNRGSNSNKSGSFFAARRKQSTTSDKSNRYSFPHAPNFFGTSGTTTTTTTTPWKRLLTIKAVVVEPKTSAELQDAMNEFEKFLALKNSSGCILMGVCRGKISEGIDFANEQSRAVVITGLPFPPAFDPKVKMKREYLDGIRSATKSNELINKNSNNHNSGFAKSSVILTADDKLSGNDWYSQQAHRAVNQAIGRVIRNQSDYGAVLLLDSRFGQPNNQLGLSKWIRPHVQPDEGFGTAIRSLASFFRTAEANATTRAEAQKKMEATSAVILKYEEDDDEKFIVNAVPSRIALIKQPEPSNSDDNTSDKVAGAAYLPPDAVVARLDVKDLKPSSSSSSSSSDHDKSTVPVLPRTMVPSNDAVFQSNNNSISKSAASKPENASKEVAIKFMAKVKSKLSLQEQATIRKAIVAMKQYGEKNEHKMYFQSASEILTIVVRCEKFEKYNGESNSEQRMLFLFFDLLPKMYRNNIESIAFDVVFRGSSLGQICKENLPGEDFAVLRSKVKALLHKVWCNKMDRISHRTDECLRAARDIFCVFEKSTLTENFLRMTNAFCMLLPKEFASKALIMSNEMLASKNIEKMKKADRARSGEETVNPARFKFAAPTYAEPNGTGAERMQQDSNIMVNPLLNDSQNIPPPVPNNVQNSMRPTMQQILVKRKGDEPFNPYAKKKTVQNVPTTTISNPYNTTARKSSSAKTTGVSTYLKSMENETYVKEKTKMNHSGPDDFVRRIQAMAPKDIECPVCSSNATEPFIAECGHVACLSCWCDWLQRSETCMTCRVQTTKESLARVVYERPRTGVVNAAVAGQIPTLTQLCPPVPADDSDDELVIT